MVWIDASLLVRPFVKPLNTRLVMTAARQTRMCAVDHPLEDSPKLGLGVGGFSQADLIVRSPHQAFPPTGCVLCFEQDGERRYQTRKNHH